MYRYNRSSWYCMRAIGRLTFQINEKKNNGVTFSKRQRLAISGSKQGDCMWGLCIMSYRTVESDSTMRKGVE